ncbi:MAG: sigma-70 family RNA polymerase sigma factor [Sphingobium sp.]
MTIALTQSGTAPAVRPVAPPQNSTDVALIERIARGDQLAMRTLFARHQVSVFRFVTRLVGDQALAEDVVSEVFFDVWRQSGRFEGRSSVSTWLLSIARHKALSACRRRPREAELDDVAAERLADPADTPDVHLQRKDESATIGRCLAQLSPEHSEVIDLVYYHEKSVAEVAAVVGIPEATVKTRMFYARKKLADLVQAA